MNWKTVLFWLASAGTVVYVLLAPNAVGFTNARVLFFHLPCAFVTTGLICFSAFLGFKYLSTGEARYDVRNAAAIELTLLFSILTMATGVLFSRYEWNAWWHNDPRQTSFLIVLLLAAAGVALRSGLADEQKAAKAAAAYTVATLLPVLFCIFVLPRILASMHPSDTIVRSKLDGTYWGGVFYVLIVLFFATRTLYLERTRLAELRNGQTDSHHDLGSAGSSSRRPVAVSQVGEDKD